MKILVTGSKGFIGSRSIKAISKEHEVKGVDAIDGFDLADYSVVCSLFSEFKPDFVIHTAANGDIQFCEQNKDIAVRNNIIATRNIASNCAKYNAGIIFCSTDHVYRYNELPQSLHEYNEIKGASFYGVTKAACEQEIRSLVCKHFITRLCWQYGIYETGLPRREPRFGIVERAAKSLKDNTPITVVRGSRQHTTYIYDTIDVFVQMLNGAFPYGIYNVASENDYTVKGLYTYILEKMGADKKKISELIVEVDGTPNILTAMPFFLKCVGYNMPTFEDGFRRYMRELHPTAVY
ncbi:MAG: sugar nucleotide-binding protein [Oscillospiraceae bacterium]|nr:sugar nucleotide-binding protein [Oscillospiraceae bacterium]